MTSAIRGMEMAYVASGGFTDTHRKHFPSTYSMTPEETAAEMARIDCKYSVKVEPSETVSKIAGEGK